VYQPERKERLPNVNAVNATGPPEWENEPRLHFQDFWCLFAPCLVGEYRPAADDADDQLVRRPRPLPSVQSEIAQQECPALHLHSRYDVPSEDSITNALTPRAALLSSVAFVGFSTRAAKRNLKIAIF
jgi:hypothetical protein